MIIEKLYEYGLETKPISIMGDSTGEGLSVAILCYIPFFVPQKMLVV